MFEDGVEGRGIDCFGSSGGEARGDACSARLIVGFAQGAGVDVEDDGDGVRRVAAGADGVAQAICELGNGELWIWGDWLSVGARRDQNAAQERAPKDQDVAPARQEHVFSVWLPDGALRVAIPDGYPLGGTGLPRDWVNDRRARVLAEAGTFGVYGT